MASYGGTVKAIVRKITWAGWQAWNLDNGTLSVTVVPELGSKVVSVKSSVQGHELLFRAPGSYRRRRFGDAFHLHDASGWDECFPSINPETVRDGDERLFPDHGEVWTLNFHSRVEDDRLILEAQGRVLPYRYCRSLILQDDRVVVEIGITNLGTKPWSALWTFHGLARWEDDMILLPPDGLPPEPLPLRGESRKIWAVLPSGSVSCGIRYPDLGATMRLFWDSKTLPALGLWMTNGGYRGDRNLAWEPADAPFDFLSVARQAGEAPIWEPQTTRTYEYTLQWSVEN